MDHLKSLKEKVENQQESADIEEANNQKQQQSTPNEKQREKPNKQVNYFQSPVVSNTILNSLASINPMSLQNNDQAFVIGICGGVSSGKSIVTNMIHQSLKSKFNLNVANIIQTDFYKDIPENVDKQNHLKNYNFDEPNAIDWEHLKEAIISMIHKKPFSAPVYDMQQEQRSKETQKYRTADVIIVEGTFIFSQESVRELFNLKIFLDTDDDIRLSRRIYKHVMIRNRDIEKVVQRYLKFTKVGFEKFTLPSKKYADIIIPNYGGGYSSLFQEDMLAGFGQIDNAALEVIINQIASKRVEHKEN